MLLALDEHCGIHEGLGDDDQPVAEAIVEKDLDEVVTEVILRMPIHGCFLFCLNHSEWDLGRTLPAPDGGGSRRLIAMGSLCGVAQVK